MKIYYSSFSGGFDSTLATLKMIAENDNIRITPVFFNYGQKSKIEESESVTKLIPVFREYAKRLKKKVVIDETKTIEIGSLFKYSQSSLLEGNSETGDPGLENRNMIFISCLASVIMSDYYGQQEKDSIDIITGFTNGYYDTTLSFIRDVNILLGHIGKDLGLHIKVIAPLIPEGQTEEVGLNKLIDIAHSLNALSILKDKTWSCYFPKNHKPCGTCGPCRKRKKIFTELGIKEYKKKRRSL